MIKRLQDLFNMFTKIVTGITICSAVFIYFAWGPDTNLDVFYLLEIILVSLLCSFGSVFLTGEDGKLSGLSMGGRLLLNFLYVNLIVFICGFFFEWFLFGWKMICGMEFTIIGVFILVTLACYGMDARTSKRINERLNKRNRNTENEEK